MRVWIEKRARQAEEKPCRMNVVVSTSSVHTATEIALHGSLIQTDARNEGYKPPAGQRMSIACITRYERLININGPYINQLSSKKKANVKFEKCVMHKLY